MTCFTLGLSRLSCHELNSQLERPVPAVKPTCAVFPVMEGISIRNDCVICVFKVRSFQDHLQGHAIVGQCYKKLMPRVQIHAEGGKLFHPRWHSPWSCHNVLVFSNRTSASVA